MGDIEKIIQQSVKAELIEWLQDNVDDAEKVLIITGYPDGRGGINLKATQYGFTYVYEISGFADWAIDSFIEDSEFDDD